MLAIAWGALAFGGVYAWAYTPLALGCATIGIAALAVERGGRPPVRSLALGLTAVACAIAVQTAPLPQPVLARVSPGSDAFLTHNDFSYAFAAARGAPEEVATTATRPAGHSISLEPQKTLLGLGLFVAFALFLLGLIRLLSVVGGRRLVGALVLCGVVLSLIGIVQYTVSGGATYLLKIYGFWQPRYRASPFGPFINRNHFAGWVIMVLPFAFAWAYAAWEGNDRESSSARRRQIAWLSSPAAGQITLMAFAAVVMGVGLVMSDSRSGMAGFVAGSLLPAWLVMRRQTSRAAGAAAAVLVALLFVVVGSWAGPGRIVHRAASVSGDLPTGGGRFEAWADTVRIARDFPVTGTGFNTYGTAMTAYQTGNRQLHFEEAHNDYLQLAAEGGLLVAVPVLFTLAAFVRDVRQRFREAPKEGTTYWLRVGAVIGLVSIALQSLVEFSLQMPGNAALFTVLAAVALHQSPRLRLARFSVSDTCRTPQVDHSLGT